MGQPKTAPGMRGTLLFLLYPLVGEILFLDTIIRDVYARRRIRVIFTLIWLAVIAIGFSASELIILLAELNGLPIPAFPLEIRYLATGVMLLVFLFLFINEGSRRPVSMEEQIEIHEDRISLFMTDSRDTFTTLNRILNAAQLRRHRSEQSDNSRLASYALTVLSEYLHTRVFSESETKSDYEP
ncbi:MAG: hypothetical protein ACFFD8_00150 [Candidatus Thorarchaeota archaeon]